MQEYDYETELMGCEAAITLVASSREEADAAYARMLAIAEEDTARYSRFLEESELSKLNAAGGGLLSPEFSEALAAVRTLHARTGGAFNPLFDISRFGYDADITEVRGKEREERDGPYDTDFASVAQEDGVLSLSSGQRLDFGGFQKGRTAERMARAAGCAGVIANLGGDLFTLGTDGNGEAFEFVMENPAAPSREARFRARDAGVATSGPTRRAWTLRGRPFHHVLGEDGKGNPDTDLVSATVIAPTGHEADGFATAALVLGSDRGSALLAREGLPHCLVRADGELLASSSFPFVTPAYA